MFPLPDLSYFAATGFLAKIRNRPVLSRSLFLHNGQMSDWDAALSDENPELYTWLHFKSGNDHDLFLPFTLPPLFSAFHRDHLQDIYSPVKNTIINLLNEYGVTDVDKYMSDSDEWLSIIFTSKSNHYAAAEIAAKEFGIEISELPAIVIWRDLDDERAVCLLPALELTDVKEYIKSLYWAITTATRSYTRTKGSFSLYLVEAIPELLKQYYYLIDKKSKYRQIRSVKISRMSEVLRKIGNVYKEKFNDAIMNFEDEIKKKGIGDSIVKYSADNYEKLRQLLCSYGFELKRHGSHEIWQHPRLKKPTPLPRHKKISPMVSRSILTDISLVSNII